MFLRKLNASLILSALITLSAFAQPPSPPFEATVLPDLKSAQKVFDFLEAKPFKMNTQCYQRAHYWSKTLEDAKKINSYKVYLLFTPKFQIEYGTAWAYHVAPMIPVQTQNGIENYVFDKTYLSESGGEGDEIESFPEKPVTVPEWAAIFAGPDHACVWVDSYADYLRLEKEGYCFLLKKPMYAYGSFSIESETTERTTWSQDDLMDVNSAVLRRYRFNIR